VKVLQLSFGIFVGEEFTVFGFVRDELKKKFRNHWFNCGKSVIRSEPYQKRA